LTTLEIIRLEVVAIHPSPPLYGQVLAPAAIEAFPSPAVIEAFVAQVPTALQALVTQMLRMVRF
jgi:hypothetical protein